MYKILRISMQKAAILKRKGLIFGIKPALFDLF